MTDPLDCVSALTRIFNNNRGRRLCHIPNFIPGPDVDIVESAALIRDYNGGLAYRAYDDWYTLSFLYGRVLHAGIKIWNGRQCREVYNSNIWYFYLRGDLSATYLFIMYLWRVFLWSRLDSLIRLHKKNVLTDVIYTPYKLGKHEFSL